MTKRVEKITIKIYSDAPELLVSEDALVFLSGQIERAIDSIVERQKKNGIDAAIVVTTASGDWRACAANYEPLVIKWQAWRYRTRDGIKSKALRLYHKAKALSV